MGAMGIDKGMLRGFLLILGIVSAVGAIFLASYIWAIVGGSIAYVAENGSLPVTSGTTTFLGTAETAFFTNLTTIQTAAGFAAALITVAVILLVFAGFIKPAKDAYGQLRGGKKKSSSGDMGY